MNYFNTNYGILKDQIKNICPETLEAHGVIQRAKDGKTHICPNCGNGTGKTGDGIVFQDKGGVWLAKCFKCGKGFDNFDLLAFHYGLDIRADFIEICKRAAADFGLADFTDFNSYHNLKPFKIEKPAPPKKASKEIEVENLTVEYIRLALSLPNGNLEKLAEKDRRGLSIETLRYFHCAYTENWVHPKTFAQYKLGLRDKLPPRSRRILIPSGVNHYVAVLIDTDRAQENKSRWKMHAGSKTEIFGLQTLTAMTNCILVYEGEFNAMSAWQAWNEKNFLRKAMNIFEADSVENLDSGEIVSAESLPYSSFVATGGAAESFWVETLDAKCKGFGIKPRVIVNFDQDQAGESGAAKVQKELRARGYLTAINFIEGDE